MDMEMQVAHLPSVIICLNIICMVEWYMAGDDDGYDMVHP